MLELSSLLNYLDSAQWLAAVVFVPLVCWQFCATQSALCRWSALISGYAMQIGFFLLLDDAGFQANLLILIASVAAYFWITTTVALWPEPRKAKTPAAAVAQKPQVPA